MKRLLTAFAITLTIPVLAISGAAQAKTFKLGGDTPVASITIPDSWSPEATDKGVEGTSKDGETYVAAELVDAKDMKSAMEAGIDFFEKSGVKIDPATLEKKEMKIGAFDAVDLSGKGTDKDGPTHVSLTLVVVSGEKVILLTYWGTATGEESNGADLGKIASSIVPAN